MNALNTVKILGLAGVTYLGVFLAAFSKRHFEILGCSIDPMPAIMVCAGFSTGPLAFALVSVFGGLAFDSLSANPLGLSVLPFFLVAFTVYLCRSLVLGDHAYAQFLLGAAAGAAAPALSLLLLLVIGYQPLFGWGSLVQLVLLAAIGGILTPLLFRLFDWMNKTLSYPRMPESAFRADREIKRGRN